MSARARAIVVAAIACGVFFRFFHADWKLYSFDEAITSLRVSGETVRSYESFVHDGAPHTMRELLRFERPAAGSSATAVVRSLAREDPQHPPLFFLLTYLEQRAGFGDGVYARRLPAIVFGTMAIAAAWWLGSELFADALTAGLFAALVSLSPFHVAYAQQAREYALWTLLTLASCAAALRVLRTGSPSSAVGCAIAIALGLWTHPFFGFVVAALAVYALLPLSRTGGRGRVLVAGALVAGVAAFVPWVRVLFAHSATAVADTAWMHASLSWPLYLGKWTFNAGTVFFDTDYVSVALAPVALALVATTVLCARRAIVGGAPRIWGFIVALGAVPALVLITNDVMHHQTYALQARYLTPLWIAFELITALGLARGLRSARANERRGWRIATAAYIACGIGALAVASFARTWWIANDEPALPAIAAVLRTRPDATIVYSDDETALLQIASSVPDDLRLLLHDRFDDRALASAGAPYAIVRPPVARAVADARVVALPALFPSHRDPLVARLRRQGARDRGIADPNDQILVTRVSRP